MQSTLSNRKFDMGSRKKKSTVATKRTEVQRAIVDLRQTRNLSQRAFAVHIRHNPATIGRWEALTPPHGRALAELSKIAVEFGRPDLAQIFSQGLDREVGIVASGGLGGIGHFPLDSAVKDLYEAAQADSSRRSAVYRAFQKWLKATVAFHAVLVQEVDQGRILKLDQPSYRQHLEQVQLQIEAMRDQAESAEHDEG